MNHATNKIILHKIPSVGEIMEKIDFAIYWFAPKEYLAVIGGWSIKWLENWWISSSELPSDSSLNAGTY